MNKEKPTIKHECKECAEWSKEYADKCWCGE